MNLRKKIYYILSVIFFSSGILAFYILESVFSLVFILAPIYVLPFFAASVAFFFLAFSQPAGEGKDILKFPTSDYEATEPTKLKSSSFLIPIILMGAGALIIIFHFTPTVISSALFKDTFFIDDVLGFWLSFPLGGFLFLLGLGIFLRKIMERPHSISIKIFIIALVILAAGSYFIFSKLSSNSSDRPQKVAPLPVEYIPMEEGSSSVLGNYKMTQHYLKGLSFINLRTQDTHRIEKGAYSAALEDGFGAWVAESRNPAAKKRSDGMPLEFDVWIYDFAAKTDELLLERFDNNLNPNAPAIAVSGRKVALPTFRNKLIVVDIDTKAVEEIDMLQDYTVFYNTIHFIGNNIIVVGSKSPSYTVTALIRYNIITKNFDKLYEISKRGYHITETRIINEKEIYWREYKEWAPPRAFKLKIE